MRGWLWVLAVSGVLLGPPAVGRPADEVPALAYDALLRIDQLPLLVDRPAYQASSYSRKDDNADAGNFLRIEKNGEQVMMDADGPGVVYRIWSTGPVKTQMSPRCRFLFYFDGEEKPRLDLSVPELFGGRGSQYPFVPPLSVTFESGAAGNPEEGPCNLCYVPIPFHKHLKVTGRNLQFYHIDYHRLPHGLDVPSWSRSWADAQREKHAQAAGIFDRVGESPLWSVVRTRGTGRLLRPVTLAPGQTYSLELHGPATINALWARLADATPRTLRGVLLRITFDDARGPSVLTPLGDFFGSGCGDRRFQSLMCGMTNEGYYSYWPMPFARRALVEVVNDTPEPVTLAEFKAYSYVPKDRPPNLGYFHARYVQDRDCALGKEYTILQVDGHRGKYVGTNITMQNARGGTGIFFLEGDEKIYCDGEKWPSRWLGTGTEDYYNGAYFWNHPNKAALVRPLGGPTFLDWGIGRVCAYRWHVPDFISFNRSIRVDQEHGGTNELPTNYQSVAYYYLDEPTAQASLPAYADRRPVTPLPPAPGFVCCELKGELTLRGKPLVRRSFHEVDPEFEPGKDGQRFAAAMPGDPIEGTLSVPGEDVFRVEVVLSGGPAYGSVDVLIDGHQVGSVDAHRREFRPWLVLPAGTARLTGGTHRLQLRVSDKGRKAHVGFVALQLHPTSPLLAAWSKVGTWPCPREGGWDQVHPPETAQDLKATYDVPGRGKLRWEAVDGTHVPFAGDWSVGYGLTYVWSPDERTVGCFLGKDDALKVWVNERVVFDVWGWSHLIPDSFFCTVSLKKGWNKLLVKNANWNGGFGYCVRLGDPDRVLKYARRPE
jgi:hypothetical protein